MPPAYAKRGKNDAADVEAICKAVTRPTMRFIAVKSCEQQAALSLPRNLLIGQRTQLANIMRSLPVEFGIAIPGGLERALLTADLSTKVRLRLICQPKRSASSLCCPDRCSTFTRGFANSTFIFRLVILLARKPVRVTTVVMTSSSARTAD